MSVPVTTKDFKIDFERSVDLNSIDMENCYVRHDSETGFIQVMFSIPEKPYIHVRDENLPWFHWAVDVESRTVIGIAAREGIKE